MSVDVRSQLQATLRGAYTLERELGGGGMSRVFVAEETRLGRKVVVKVLSPELAAGISADRFEREIKVAASLQQANIVPLLNAGESAGLPYYTMPFVEGESLRIRLQRGALPIGEAVNVLRDVARALAYAHERGIVHRDIKPDNVLLSGGAAVVTDFGIAKAISASRTASGEGATLTQLGTSIGTPAYISPEQAAGDPDVDHRADIYSFGCMAYELLAGRPPFVAKTPQRLLGAHMSEKPQPIAELRADTPLALATLVMGCLEKEASARPQSAAELFPALEASQSSDGAHAAVPGILLGGPGTLRKALALYAVAFLIVAIVAKAAIVGIGLPDWVFPGALIVMALGLPVILLTAYSQYVSHRAFTVSPTLTPGGTPSMAGGTMATIAMKASPHLSWRRTTLGGVYAVGAFVVAIGAFMLLRALGIGPAGSLLARGAIERHGRILVADFASPASDTSLGAVLTEALRAGLGQSRSIVVVQPTTVRDVLRRMQRPANARVDFSLAREVATREGIKAIVDGEIIAVGGKYSIAARLIGTQAGEVLASFRESADDSKEILPALDRLTKSLRERIGESLKTIRDAPPLEQVTTPSLEALRKYVQGTRALSFEGDFNKGAALLEEAIALDSGFAMAYRKLAVELNNRGGQGDRVALLLEKAFEHRERLSDGERYLTLGAYYASGAKPDQAKAISAYESLIDLQPDNATALNNVSILYQEQRDYSKAEGVLVRAAALEPPLPVVFNNLGYVSVALGKREQVDRAITELATRFPANALSAAARARLTYALGRLDSAIALTEASYRAHLSDLPNRANSAQVLAELAVLRGRVAEARQWYAASAEARRERGLTSTPLNAALDAAWLDAWLLDDKPRAARVIDAALAVHPLESLPDADRPYLMVGALQALLARPERARATVELFDRTKSGAALSAAMDRIRHTMLGDIAVAERRYADAVREYRDGDRGNCRVCMLPRLAHAYDLAGEADSARVVFTRYVDTRDVFHLSAPGGVGGGADADYLAGTYKRLGELWEAKGDKQKAASYYAKFVDLWTNADPELQPRVAEIRTRLARLSDSEAKR